MYFPRWKIHPAAPAVAAALFSLALYAITLGGTYIFDDVQIISHDTRIQSLSQWPQIWTHDYFNGAIDNLYRPLTTQTFALQWFLHGDRPWLFHLVNILLNAAAAGAVAELARRLAGISPAFIAGLLFAAHPVHVEAVAEIVGRSDELCLLFMLASLILFLRRPMTISRVLAIAACSVGAMLSKEQGMLMPALLLALGLLTHYRSRSPREKQATQILLLLLSWSLAALIVLREEILHLRFEWELRFLDFATQPLIRSAPGDHALIVFVILGRYAQLLIAPLKLSMDYGLSVMTPLANTSDPYLYLGFATAIAGIAAIAFSLRHRQWSVAFCLIAAALCYGMISNVILIGTIFGERLLYIPSAFLLIAISIYLAHLPRRVMIAAFTVLLTLASLRTVTYAARWNDRRRFYETSLAEQPKSVRLHLLLAVDLLNDGDLSTATTIAADGCRITPEYWNIWYCAAQIAERAGNLPQALALYQKAFSLQQFPSLDLKIRTLQRQLVSATQRTTATSPTDADPIGDGMPASEPVNSPSEHP